jgi:hypothetical protein
MAQCKENNHTDSIKENKKPQTTHYVTISLNTEKAFDKIQHLFIPKVLQDVLCPRPKLLDFLGQVWPLTPTQQRVMVTCREGSLLHGMSSFGKREGSVSTHLQPSLGYRNEL